ncbi:uncharacterized protein LOC128177750 [Crassostrea angulata]|uniref:uncharacterized protein LOC128177750 n=1 Tax=Magallana angulata TaxID=2784310 RepID=UPI0022B15008|nr:uncharacterized protein LOC128177750 [Crassostrea angulata]
MNLLSPVMRFIVSTMLIQLALQMCWACLDGFRKSTEGKCLETTICYPGEGYRLGDGSMTNPKDICYKCPNGTYNRDIIDTAKLDNIQLDVCAPIDCSCGHDGTIIKNDDSCEKGEEKICVCDREHLFYGWDPLACQRMEDQSLISRIKRPGNELTNSGEVQRCRKGYFKTSGDLSICKPHTSCAAEVGLRVKVEGTATSDAVCENATDVPSSREITSYPPIDEIVTNNVTYPTDEEPGMPGHVYAILAVIGLLILVIITICFCAYRYPEHFPCLQSLIEKIKQRHLLRRNEPDTPRDEHFIHIYQDINEVVVDQCQPSDELTDSSEPSSDLPSYVRNDAFSRPETLGNLDSCGSETSLFKPFPNPSFPVDTSHGGGRPIGSVAPMVQESINSVIHPSNLASPSENDRGELMVSGQRARDDDGPLSEQLDSGLGEQ